MGRFRHAWRVWNASPRRRSGLRLWRLANRRAPASERRMWNGVSARQRRWAVADLNRPC
jgi:hypothetical protein